MTLREEEKMMRKSRKRVFILLLACVWLPAAFAQSTAHYQLMLSEVDGTTAQEALQLLESNVPLYKAYLAGAPDPSEPLNISFYRNRERFNDALAPQGLPAGRGDFIYLDFNDPKRNVLYIYPLDIKDAQGNSSAFLSAAAMEQKLNRHGFLQYSLTVLPKAPAWLREGSALMFEAIEHNSDGTAPVLVGSRSDYLVNLKRIHSENPMPLADLLALTDGMNGTFLKDMERNLTYAWGFVHYLTATGQQGVLTEAVRAVDDSKSYEENRAAVAALIGAKNLQNGFYAYITDSKSFPELIDEGKAAFESGSYEQARALFTEASQARSDLYTAYYYLGLVNFTANNYEEAKNNYSKALEKGAPEALINFSLGYTAFKEGDYQQAAALLSQAKAADFANYGSRADAILKVIPAQEELKAQAPAPQSANATAEIPVS
jgi:tetratricopeptide (TPR) repeat protein